MHRPLILAFLVVASACSPFSSKTVTTSELDKATLSLTFSPAASDVGLSGFVKLNDSSLTSTDCPELPGLVVTVDGHEILSRAGGAGDVPGTSGGLGAASSEPGCVGIELGAAAVDANHPSTTPTSVPASTTTDVSTVLLKSSVRDITMKVSGLTVPRTLALTSSTDGSLQPGDTATLEVSVATDTLVSATVAFVADPGGQSGGLPGATEPTVSGDQLSFTVPAGWSGTGKLDVAYAVSAGVVACDGIGTCEANANLQADVPVDVVP